MKDTIWKNIVDFDIIQLIIGSYPRFKTILIIKYEDTYFLMEVPIL